MPQHLWRGDQKTFRVCEVCLAPQVYERGEWYPPLYPICRGDDDNGDGGGRRQPPRSPRAPSSPQRVLELA
jgi:hypothetical protein